MRIKLLPLLCFVVTPIVFGALFYYIFCPDIYFVKAMDAVLGQNRYHINLPSNNNFIILIRSYLMDFLWAFGLMASTYIIFGDDCDIGKVSIIIIFEILMEVIQLHHDMRGTFDIWDIVVEMIANIIVIYLMRKRGVT